MADSVGPMNPAVLIDRGGAVVWAGPPERVRMARAAGAVAGLAPRLVGPGFIVASCASLQVAAALATTVFAAFGPAGTGALRFLAAAVGSADAGAAAAARPFNEVVVGDRLVGRRDGRHQLLAL
jgi:hypothetical protein